MKGRDTREGMHLGTIRCVTRESKAAEIVANGSSSRACAASECGDRRGADVLRFRAPRFLLARPVRDSSGRTACVE